MMKYFCSLVLMLLSWQLSAQVAQSDKLGMLCNFEITSNAIDIGVSNQVIAKKIISAYNSSKNAYRILERYELQFVCRKKLVQNKRSAIKKSSINKSDHVFFDKAYFVSFRDENDQVVFEFTTDSDTHFQQEYNTGKTGYFIYAIPLPHFPMVLLKKVKQIDIQIVD